MTVSFADPFDIPQFSKKYSVILKRRQRLRRFSATCKWLCIRHLIEIRVEVFTTLKMPKYLLLSGLLVALAEAMLWSWQAEQRHGPRRIAKHPELSELLPLPACKVQS